MFSHATTGARDLPRLTCFRAAASEPSGSRRRGVAPDGGPPAACWVHAGAVPPPRFTAYTTLDGCTAASLAPSPEAVRDAHAMGFAAGGTDEGAPGERSRSGRGCHGAHLRDPEGSKPHVVRRGGPAAE